MSEEKKKKKRFSRKAKWGCLGALFILFSPIIIILTVLTAFLMSDGDCSTGVATSTASATSSEVTAGDDWLTEGTTSYNNAKKTFDDWVKKGLSGAGSAGIVGWVNSEGGFAMVGRAEGHYGSDLESNSISKGVTPIASGSYAVGGGGIYQFTPYTKYAPLGDSKWEDIDAMNAFVGKNISAGDWNSAMDLNGANSSFEDLAKATDPKKASLMWNAYERGDTAYINKEQKQNDAQSAYDKFNGSKYKYNAKKFKKAFGKADEVENNSSLEDNKLVTNKVCGSNGSGSWSVDGGNTLGISATNSAWEAGKVPQDMQKYALDPKSVGLAFKSSTGWNVIVYSGGQCTDLTASLMYALWEKDGQHPKMAQGNGGEVASNWAKNFGGKTSDKPTAGAVFSQTASGAGNSDGHTGVVSHVFDDGSFLVVEQNYSTLSGENGGYGQYTWSYRVIFNTNNAIKKLGFSFYDLSQAGYSLVSDAKAIA